MTNYTDKPIARRREAARLLIHDQTTRMLAKIERNDAYRDDDIDDSGEMASAVAYERIVATAAAEGRCGTLLALVLDVLADSMSPAQYRILVDNVRASEFVDVDYAIENLLEVTE